MRKRPLAGLPFPLIFCRYVLLSTSQSARWIELETRWTIGHVVIRWSMRWSRLVRPRWIGVRSKIQDRISPFQQWALLLGPFDQPGLFQFAVWVGEGTGFGCLHG